MPRPETAYASISEVEKAIDRERGWGYTDDPEFSQKVIFPLKQLRPKYGQFARQYADIERQRDRNFVEQIKNSAEFRREKSSESVGLEYCFMEGIKVHGWFGDEVEGTMPTIEYDDVANGVDFVVYFYDDKEGKFLPLAVDATTSTDLRVFQKKFKKIQDSLNRNFLTTVKYAEDPDGEKNKAFMPRIVLGANAETTLKIQKMLVRKETDKMTIEDKALEQEVRDLSLQMAHEQLAFFAYYYMRRRGIAPKLTDKELENLDYQKVLAFANAPQATRLMQKDQQFSQVLTPYLKALEFICHAQQKNPRKISEKLSIPSYLRPLSSQENLQLH